MKDLAFVLLENKKRSDTLETIKKFVIKNPCYKNGRTIEPKGVMLHSVGVAQPDPLVLVNKFDNENIEVCVHGFIGKERAYQIMPWNRRAWHCGGSGNNTHIGIEMTEPSTINYTGGSTWTDRNPIETREFIQSTYKNAVELFAIICKEYELNPLLDGVVISHSEGCKRGIASNHADVEHIWSKFGFSMDQFRIDINEKMKGDKYMVEKKIFCINGNDEKLDTILQDGKNYVEIRGISEALGLEVLYDSKTKRVNINTVLENIKIKVNGVRKDIKRIFIKDENFVRLRDIEDDKITIRYNADEKMPEIEIK